LLLDRAPLRAEFVGAVCAVGGVGRSVGWREGVGVCVGYVVGVGGTGVWACGAREMARKCEWCWAGWEWVWSAGDWVVWER
jgi:hypothetical protein